MAGVLQHLRSSTLNKRPNPASMVDGQIAINYASGSPGAFFKDTNGNLVKVGPVHVGATAPNVSPASGGTAGNSLGEQWLDTSGGTYVFKIWDGAAWRSEAGEFVNSTGDTMTGSLTMGPSANLIFEGSTDDGFETTLTVVDPTADRTITLPNVSGTVVTTGDSGTVTSTMIADGTIVNADVNASAAIAGTKISPDFGSQTIQTTGVFSHAVGSAGAPTIAFTGDTNTGIYSPGADQVAISTGGSGRLFVGPTGQIGISQSSLATGGFTAGTLRIGHSTGQTAGVLLQNTSTAADSSFWYTDGTGSYLGSNNGFFAHFAGGSERLRIDSSGRVGIGTSSPDENLEIRDSIANGGPIIRLRSTDAFANSEDQIGGLEFYNGDLDIPGVAAYIKTLAGPSFGVGGQLAFGTQETWSTGVLRERMRIDSSGRVGIGTTSPTDAQLYVNSSAIYGVRINHATLPLQSFLVNGTQAFTIGANSGGGGSFYYGTGNVEAARIDSSGRLLVGTSSQSGGALLQVNGDRVRIATAKTPASATDTGTAGEICWDASYVYVCTATNTWKRSALSTW